MDIMYHKTPRTGSIKSIGSFPFILTLHILFLLFYVLLMPAFEGADEPDHLRYIEAAVIGSLQTPSVRKVVFVDAHLFEGLAAHGLSNVAGCATVVAEESVAFPFFCGQGFRIPMQILVEA